MKFFDVAQGSLNVTPLNIIDDDLVLDANKYNLLFIQHLEEDNYLERKLEIYRYLLDECEASTLKFDILAW